MKCAVKHLLFIFLVVVLTGCGYPQISKPIGTNNPSPINLPMPSGTLEPIYIQTTEPTGASTLFPTPTNTSTPIWHIYYVDAQIGLDRNNGSINAPWRTIQKAADTATAGDTVYIRKGTYNEYVMLNLHSGTQDRWIVFTNYPGETPVIDGANLKITSGGLLYLSQVNYIEIKGLRVINSNQAGIYAHSCSNIIINYNSTRDTRSSGIGVWWSSHVRVNHNIVVNAVKVILDEESISIANSMYFEVSYNDVSLDGVQGLLGNEAICTKDSRFGIVHHNYVHDFEPTGGAIYVCAWKELTGDIDVYSNQLHKAGYIAINSERGGIVENINVYNNTVYSVGWAGIALSTTGAAYGGNGLRRNINIHHNTVYDILGDGGAGIYITTSNIEKIDIRNNIVYVEKDNGQIVAGTPEISAKITAQYNLVYGSKYCANDHPNCVEMGNWATNITADPMFVDLVAPDLHLQTNSPAIDVGVNDGTRIDLDGVTRPQGNGFDIGAYEYFFEKQK
jgi:hypothetical protein